MKRVLSAVFVVMFVVGFTVNVSAQDGKALYGAKCAMCHGPNADGKDKNGKDKNVLGANAAKLNLVGKTEAQVRAAINDGVGKMKPYKDKMTADEITSVVKFICSLKK